MEEQKKLDSIDTKLNQILTNQNNEMKKLNKWEYLLEDIKKKKNDFCKKFI